MKNLLLVPLFLLLLSFPAVAGEGTLRLSLAEACQRALAAAPRLRQLDALEEAAAAGLAGAEAARRPEVNLLAGYARVSKTAEFQLSLPAGVQVPPLFPSLENAWRSRIEASVPVLTGNRLPSLVEAAALARQAAREDRQAGTRDLVLETTTAFWNLVTARRTAAVLREALAAYEAHLADALKRREFGLAAPNEVLAVEVERDRAELTRIQAEAAAEVLESDLARLLGLEGQERLELVEPLETTPRADWELEQLYDLALRQRPELRALEARAEGAEAAARAARAERRPQLAASAGFDYSNPNKRVIPNRNRWDETWDLSLALSFNLFDAGRSAAAVARHRAQAEGLREAKEDAARRIRLEVGSRVIEWRTAEAALPVTGQALAAARENLRVAGVRYLEGVAPSSERLDAEVALLRAGLDRTEALARVRLVRARLDRALGNQP